MINSFFITVDTLLLRRRVLTLLSAALFTTAVWPLPHAPAHYPQHHRHRDPPLRLSQHRTGTAINPTEDHRAGTVREFNFSSSTPSRHRDSSTPPGIHRRSFAGASGGPISEADRGKIEAINKVRSLVPSEEVEIIVAHDRYRTTGRRILQFSFAIRGITIPGYRINMNIQNWGSVLTAGLAPQARFDEAIYSSHQFTPASLETIREAVWHSLDPELRTNKNIADLNVLAKNECTLIKGGVFVPGRCYGLRLAGDFLEARFTSEGLSELSNYASKLCGTLEGIYSDNITSGRTTEFEVDICDGSESRGILANERFLFEGVHFSGEDGVHECTQHNQIPNLNNWDPPEQVAAMESEAEIAVENNHFSYANDDSVGYRMMHAYAHLNRMMDWFEFTGFEVDDQDIIRLYLHDTEDSVAHYTFLRINDEETQKHTVFHLISLGPEKGYNSFRASTDFDVSAHELSHYIIYKEIGSPQTFDDNLINNAIHEGLADYFTYAATGNGCLGESIYGGTNDNPTCLRTSVPSALVQKEENGDIIVVNFVYGDMIYNTLAAHENRYHDLGQLVSGVLWKAREQVARKQRRHFDHMVLNALSYLSPSSSNTFQDFILATFQSDQELDPDGTRFCSDLKLGVDTYFKDLTWSASQLAELNSFLSADSCSHGSSSSSTSSFSSPSSGFSSSATGNSHSDHSPINTDDTLDNRFAEFHDDTTEDPLTQAAVSHTSALRRDPHHPQTSSYTITQTKGLRCLPEGSQSNYKESHGGYLSGYSGGNHGEESNDSESLDDLTQPTNSTSKNNKAQAKSGCSMISNGFHHRGDDTTTISNAPVNDSSAPDHHHSREFLWWLWLLITPAIMVRGFRVQPIL